MDFGTYHQPNIGPNNCPSSGGGEIIYFDLLISIILH